MRAWPLGAILAAGLLIRLVHLGAISETAFFQFPLVHDQSDMYAFWEWANTILAGDWLGRDTYRPYFDWMKKIAPLEFFDRWIGKTVFHQAPFYAYFVAGLRALNDSMSTVLFVQVLIGSLQPLIMYFLARRLFDDRSGLFAAALTALYGPFAFYDAVILRDWLPPMLEPLIVLLALCARDSRTAGSWVVLGGVMGVAALTKETTILLSIVVTGWLAFQLGRPNRQTLRPMAFLLAGILLCMMPLVLRNALVGAPLYAISGQGAGSVYIGLVAEQDPIGLRHMADEAGEVAVRAEGRLLDHFLEGLRTYRGDYWKLLRHELQKLRGLVDPYEPPNNVNYYYGLEISPLLRFTLDYRYVLPLGLSGVFLLLRQPRRYSLFHLYGLAALAVQMVTVILSRFRLELVPVLILGSAYFLTTAVHLYEERRWSLIAGMSSLLLTFALIQVWATRFDPVTNPARYAEFAEYKTAAQIYASQGRFDLATSELGRYRDKVRRSPSDAQNFYLASADEGDYRVMWARELAEIGKLDDARQQTRTAEQIYSEQTVFNYPLYNLGMMYFKLGDPETGKAYLKRYLLLEPEGSLSGKAKALLDR